MSSIHSIDPDRDGQIDNEGSEFSSAEALRDLQDMHSESAAPGQKSNTAFKTKPGPSPVEKTRILKETKFDPREKDIALAKKKLAEIRKAQSPDHEDYDQLDLSIAENESEEA